MKRNRITFLIAELILVAIAGIFINRIFREDNPQKRVAVILPDSGNTRWEGLVNGLKQSAQVNNIHLIICNTDEIVSVDDEKEIADLLEVYLKNDNYIVHKYYNGIEALECIQKTEIDLAILDVMLPDIDGFRICQKIRENYYFPVIMLTAKIDDGDKIMGLTIGADDYITKPFNPLEVIARVKTQLRRYQKYNNPTKKQFFPKSEYDIRGLIINKDTHKCFLFGKEISLTPIEFSILWYLCEHQGKVVSTEELFENIWKEKYLDNNNTVMAHIGRLREKLNEPAKNPKFIKTVWGVGYEIE
jgi:two-component system response regulator VanR